MALIASALAMTPLFYSGALALPQLVVPHVEGNFLNITVVSTTTVYTDSATDKCAAPTTTEYIDSVTGDRVSPETTATVTVASSTSESADWETDEPVQTEEPSFDGDEESFASEDVCAAPTSTSATSATSASTTSTSTTPTSTTLTSATSTSTTLTFAIPTSTTSTSTKEDWETNKPIQTTEPPFDAEDPAAKTVDTTTSTSTAWETNKPIQTTEPPFDDEDPANPSKGMSTSYVAPGNPGIPTFYIGPQTITVTPEYPIPPPPTSTPDMPNMPDMPDMPDMPGMPGMGDGMGDGMDEELESSPGIGGGLPGLMLRRAAALTTTETSASASWDYHYGVPPVVASLESAPVSTSRRHKEPAEDSSKTALPTVKPTGILPPRPAFPAVSTKDNGDVTYGDHWSMTVGPYVPPPRSEDADDSDADSDADENGDDESTQEQPSPSFGPAKTLSGHIVGRPTPPKPKPETTMATVTGNMTTSSTRAPKTWGSDTTLKTVRKTSTSPDVPTDRPGHHNSLLKTWPHHKTTPSPETTTPPPSSSHTITHRELVTQNGLVYNKATGCTAVVVRIRGALSTLKGCPATATPKATVTVASGRRRSAPPLLSEECHHHIRNGTTHPPPRHCMHSIDRIDQ